MTQSLRWVRLAGLIVIAVVITLSVAGQPAPGLTGTGLGVSLSLVALAAATLALLRPRGVASTVAALTVMILSSAALVWLQPDGVGAAGLFVAVSFAAMRLADRMAVAMLAFAAVAFVPAAVHADRSGGMIVGTELGIIGFYLMARFARSAAEAHERSERLLVELEAGRAAEAEAAALRERSRVARDMHDVLAHSLSGLMLQLEGARVLSRQPDANGQLPMALDRAHHLARAGLEEARRAIAALRDEHLPGPDGLQQLAAEFERDSQARISLGITGAPRRLDSESSLTLYRVAQEALTNVRKHAHADSVEIRLSYETDGTRLIVSDSGSGRGVAPVADNGGYGLTGMRERAELLGGRLDAGPTADGFRVELWIPA
jgi:signal transduction histidine kinase